MNTKRQRSRREQCRRYISFIFILFVIALGTSLSIRANLGSSPISAPPYVLSLVPGVALTMGQLTILMHVAFIAVQWALLRKDFEKRQFLQLAVSFLFGFYTDVTMWLTGFLQVPFTMNPAVGYPLRFAELLIGGSTLAFGIACEVRCDSLMLAGEGLPLAISKFTKRDFGKVKICSDTSLVAIAAVLMLVFFGHWDWKLVGAGTLVSMFFVGFMVRVFAPHIAWLDKIFIPADERMSAKASASVQTATGNVVVTIAREYGSGGRLLGLSLSHKLGIPFYDREIIDKAAAELGYPTDVVAHDEQNISSAKLWELILTDKSVPPSMHASTDDSIFVAESRVILSLAAKGPCIVIGRLGNWVMRDNPRALRIFVTSGTESAVKRVMEKDKLNERDARKKILQVNRGRSNHYWQYTGHQWTDAREYDLVVNTDKAGIEGTADIVAAVLRQAPYSAKA